VKRHRARVAAAGAAVLLALGTAAVLWPQGGSAPAPGAAAPQGGAHAAAAPGPYAAPGSARAPGASFFTRRSAHAAADNADPLLAPGLRDSLEALLADAGEAGDPEALKQRLAALVSAHFPAELSARALALAGRYVDYRVALGRLSAPQDPTDPGALRDALEARHQVRQQFFDDAEYDALFARADELDRYTLARLEIARNPDLSAEQRAQALRAAESELPAERRAEREAATAHLAAAAQTAAFNAQNADDYTRHAARSAQYGEAAAHALARLDREERDWQQRLDQYSQARAQGDGPALQQLRLQLFTAEEQQRVDAALALRSLGTGS